MATNIRALTERQPDGPALARYRETAVLLTGQAEATVEDGVAWVRQLGQRLNVRPLGGMGFDAAQTDDAVSKARQASSMKGNPVALTEEELTDIYSKAL